MIRALFKFVKPPDIPHQIVDTTSGNGSFCELSPFVLTAPPANRFENLWQFSKVYQKHIGKDGLPNADWWQWRDWGFAQTKAYRYPMGKGTIPEYSYWRGEKLDYIGARKKIYAPIYAENVSKTDSYKRLQELDRVCSEIGEDLILLDYDAYDHRSFGMSLIDVINNPKRKMGHAFVLMMMLTDMLEECVIPTEVKE